MSIAMASVNRGTGKEAWWPRRDLQCFVLILLFALALRLSLFTGFYGSDEVTYLQMAYGIWRGAWLPSDYVGALRYGMNIPTALSMKVFGVSELSAGLWGLLTSVGEVGLIFWAARCLWGLRAAVCAGLILASLPLHVHFAGRLMADAPLAFFISTSFILVWLAERENSSRLYLLAGLATGSLYWIKDAVFFITLLLLGLYILLGWRWHFRWLWTALAVLLMVFANWMLMWKVHGDPFHLFAAGQQSLGHLAPVSKTAATYYLRYLLLDIKHTWLLFYFVLGAVFVLVRRRQLFRALTKPEGFVLLWAFGFLALLSVVVLRQTNYMLIFVGPLALLAGYFAASLTRAWRVSVMALFVLGGVILSAFEQQAVQAFTANSRATVDFAERHPRALVFASTGAIRADSYQGVLGNVALQRLPLLSVGRLKGVLAGHAGEDELPGYATATEAYALMDPQMAGWGDPDDSDWRELLASTCVLRRAELAPAQLGLGRYVTDALIAASGALPASMAGSVKTKLQSTLRPQPGTVFAITAPCFMPKTGSSIPTLK